MTDPATAPPPIAIDRVERARGRGDEVRLRLSGRWLGPGDPAQHDPLLVVQLHGRRHRFAADRPPTDAKAPPSGWRAEFTVPAWAVPERPGQAAVWVGNSVVAVGPPGSPPPERLPEPPSETPPWRPPVAEPIGPPIAQEAPAGGPQSSPELAPAIETPRAGPLADLLFKETVSALHAELERRSEEAAQLRGSLADARSELDVRAARQAGLESAHAQLRHELEQLTGAVARRREEHETRVGALEDELERAREQAVMAAAARDDAHAELARARQEAASRRDQLAAANVSRDAAISEAGGLRAELERLGAELTVVREQMAAQGGDLGEAQRLVADARALSEQLRSSGDA